MNFNNTWRNYINQRPKSKGRLLGEQIIREYKLLAEGKKDEAKKIAPIADHFGIIHAFSQQLRALFGDKGVGKYIMFCAREIEEVYKRTYYKNDQGTYSYRPEAGMVSISRVFEEILGAVRQFHTVQNRLDQKDINKYTLQSLRRTIDNLPESETARKKRLRDKSEAEKNSEIVYNKNGIMAVRPLTTQASCYFGHNPRLTTWCISTKSKRNYFDQYTKEESKAFVIVRFFGIPEDDPSHIISMQWSGPGEPEFEMYWDAPNESQNPDDLYGVVQQHVEGMYPDEEESWEDLTQELHDALYEAAQENVFETPPDDPADNIAPKCEAIEAAFDEKSEYTNLWWEIDQDTFQQDGYVGVYFGAKTEIQLEPEDYKIPAEEIDNPKLDYSFWRKIEKRWEEACKKGGLYIFEEYELYPTANANNMSYRTVPGAIVLEMKHEADTTLGGYTLEGFEEFARDTLEIEREDAIKSKELAIAILQEAFAQLDLGLPAEDEQGLDSEIQENMFYKDLEKKLLGEEKECAEKPGCNCLPPDSDLTVAQVQEFLASKYGRGQGGLVISFRRGYADNICGPETRGFIMKFQKDSNLECNACVEGETYKAMIDASAGMQNQDTPMSIPSDDIDASPPSTVSIGDETQSKANFPVVNGKNLILPIKGVPGSWGAAGFSQRRGSGIHGSLDQFVPVGTPVRAMADGHIKYVSFPGNSWDTGVIARLSSVMNQRMSSGALRADFAAVGFTIGKVPAAPSSWTAMRKWAKMHLPRDAMARLVRYYKKKGIWSGFPVGGREIVYYTNADQNGNVFKVLYSHLEKTYVSSGQKIKAGQVIATVGNSGIFDSDPHLHWAMANAKFAETSRARFNPSRAVPDLSGAGRGLYKIAESSTKSGSEKFYKELERELLPEEIGRSRQRGIYKFYCMIAYNLSTEENKARGLDDILADLRALPNVTIVTVVIRNQKVQEGRYIAGLSVKFIPSVPGQFNAPEDVKARIIRDVKRLANVQSLFKVSAGLERLE